MCIFFSEIRKILRSGSSNDDDGHDDDDEKDMDTSSIISTVESIVDEQVDLRRRTRALLKKQPEIDKCNVREATLNRLPLIKRSMREISFRHLNAYLRQNMEAANLNQSLITAEDLRNIARNIEYYHFKNSSTNVLYRYYISKEVGALIILI